MAPPKTLSDYPTLPFITQPPLVKRPYTPEKALEDLPGLSYALHLFLASHMIECEDFCQRNDPERERLYFSSGYGLIQVVKSLMSFEDDDLLSAINHVKQANSIASSHRKRAASLPTRFAGLIIGSLNTSGVGWISSMTPVERHAELVYAETLYERAVVGIAYSGDWLAFIKEALNMRTAFNIYRQLGKYLEQVDAEYAASLSPPPPVDVPVFDPRIDAHFRTGVYLGVGSANLTLSLMPSRLLSLIELFGYKGDRMLGLKYLYLAGGWDKMGAEPGVQFEQEGVRRTICDMTLLIFHLVLSTFTYEGVDITMAEKILNYHLKRYPNGVFFLFGQGRLHLCRSQPAQAIECYQRAMSAQTQYRNLHHISYWEMSIAHMALWDVEKSLENWRHLEREATWSKATYTYGMAVCLLQLGGDEHKAEATRLMGLVAGRRQRIAGKSIPLEKFVARKARKFQSQSYHLALPALEFGYHFQCIGRAPRRVVLEQMLPVVEDTLKELGVGVDGEEKEKERKEGHWDDLCLALFLHGVCLRYVAYPEPVAVVDPSETTPTNTPPIVPNSPTFIPKISREEAAKRAIASFESVFRHGTKIELDHFLVYFAHFELGRLLACIGDKQGARHHLELVISGKPLEVNAAGRRGKYSMEGNLHVRTNAALEALEHGAERL